jgi:hypothetical protein
MDDDCVTKTWHLAPLALNSPARHAEFKAALTLGRLAAES